MLHGLKIKIRDVTRRFGYDVARLGPDADPGYLLALLCNELRIDCTLDVGAHRGGFATMLLESGYRGYIRSFEPVSSHYESLKLKSERLASGRWEAYNMALGAADGELDINVEAGSLSSFLTPNDFARELFAYGCQFTGKETVTVRRLDTVFDEVTRPLRSPRVLLKMDTQGWETEVVKGASGCLAHVYAIFAEVSVQPIYENMVPMLEFIPYVQNLGFELAGMFPVSRASDYTVVEFDCVMVRPGAKHLLTH